MTDHRMSVLLRSLFDRWQRARRWFGRFFPSATGGRPEIPVSRSAPLKESERRPFVRRRLWTTSLQFTDTEAQSRMLTFRPQALLIGYTRSMMGFIRLNPAPQRIAMIGLGGGSLAKYCYRHLPQSSIDVVEINPHVLQLRRTFKVPADDTRFRVLLDDGALFIRQNPQHYDVLLVDGYDASGIPLALASQRFYNDCRNALRPGGVLVVNLFCEDGERHLQRIRHAFDRAVISIAQPGAHHVVALAWLQPLSPPSEQTTLSAKAQRDLTTELTNVDQATTAWQAKNSNKPSQPNSTRNSQ